MIHSLPYQIIDETSVEIVSEEPIEGQRFRTRQKGKHSRRETTDILMDSQMDSDRISLISIDISPSLTDLDQIQSLDGQN